MWERGRQTLSTTLWLRGDACHRVCACIEDGFLFGIQGSTLGLGRPHFLMMMSEGQGCPSYVDSGEWYTQAQ